MKKVQSFFNLVIISFLTFSSCIGQTAEDCTGYFPLNEGASFEITSYDKKDKLTAIINHTVLESNSIENGIEAKCNMIITDKDGNTGQEITYDSKCQDGKYYLNMETMMSAMTSQYEAQGMEVKMEDGLSVIPNNLSVGDVLDDNTMTMTVSSSAIDFTMTITTSERTITGKETITTPAGTFECMILSQKSTIKMGDMINITTSSKEWLSKGVGAVRSESYDKKGKPDGYSLLTKFSK